jgi:hypothetical protein
MGGGLMQLVAYGAQDIYLTGNPQITFFKVVYRRHTNFSMETIEQTINGSSATSGGTGTVTVSRNGDLLSNVYVSSNTASIESGDEIVSEVVCEIGGQQVDKHTRDWMRIQAELTTPAAKADGYKAMTCSLNSGLASTGTAGASLVQVPIRFWFCNNPGLALPLIALQYHEVKLKFTWGTAALVGVAATCKVWADYIYLDTDERRRFAQVSHEYLIEQLQYASNTAASKLKLNFNHPVKEIIWTDSDNVAYSDAKITLNGHDRFAAQESEYFQLRQPYQYHTAVPGYNVKMTDRPQMLATPLEILQDAVTSDAAPDAGEGWIAAEDTDVSVVTLGTATSGSSTPKVGDIVMINVADQAAAGTDGSITGFHVVSVATSTTVFSVTPGLPVSTTADSISISLVARAQDPQSRCSSLALDINCYSFALKPEEHQPSGTCNFSRIDTAYLQFGTTVPTGTVNVYAVNYNVLRIMSGMGGLAYSN